MNETPENAPSSVSETREIPERKVGMGEIDSARGPIRLRTLLGSCVGLVIYDLRSRVGGLAHIVLPASNGQTSTLGKYADTAVPELLRQITLLNGRTAYLAAKIAGGANMFGTSGPKSIGDQNIAAVEQLLKAAGIPVLGRHCGGRSGRKIAFEIDTGRFTVEIVGSIVMEL